MSKYLDSVGLSHYTEKLKNGTIVAGKANSVPASGITGVIDISHIPNGALERLVKVANKAARLKLTANDIQLGDTVQEVDTGLMYIVVDQTKLNSADGYQEYTVGTASKAATADNATNASKVPWSGVQNHPTTLGGYGITDGFNDVTNNGDGNAVANLSKNGQSLLKTMASFLQKLTINGVSKSVGKDGALSFSLAEIGMDVPDVYKDTAANTTQTFAIYHDWNSDTGDTSLDPNRNGFLITFKGNGNTIQYLLLNSVWSTRAIIKGVDGNETSDWEAITELPNTALTNDEIDAAIAAAK